jgi:hypothetical protein
VKNKTNEYFYIQYYKGQWFDGRVEAQLGAVTRSDVIWQDWVSFARASSIDPGTRMSFSEWMKTKGHIAIKSSGMVYKGIKLKAVVQDDKSEAHNDQTYSGNGQSELGKDVPF